MAPQPYTVHHGSWTNIAPALPHAQAVKIMLVNNAPVWIETAPQQPHADFTNGMPMTEIMEPVEVVVPAGQTLWCRAISRNSRIEVAVVDTGTGTGQGTGWADYTDTEYTIDNRFRLPRNTPTALPNNGAGGNRSQEPIPLYDGRIRGNAGDGLLLTIRFHFETTGNKKREIDLQTWIDFGLGPHYARSGRVKSWPGGRPITYTTGAYCLGFWQKNGAEFFVQSSHNLTLWDIEYVIHRLHAGS